MARIGPPPEFPAPYDRVYELASRIQGEAAGVRETPTEGIAESHPDLPPRMQMAAAILARAVPAGTAEALVKLLGELGGVLLEDQHVLSFSHDLACGMRLETTVLTDHQRVTNVYSHHFVAYPEGDLRQRKPEIVNKWKLWAEYRAGDLAALSLRMDITLPERLGRKFAFGMDISPGAKTYLQFIYQPHDDGSWRLTTIEKGSSVVLDVSHLTDDQPEGAVTPPAIDFPFPVPDRLEQRCRRKDGTPSGGFLVPFRCAGREDPDDMPTDEIRYVTIRPHMRRRG